MAISRETVRDEIATELTAAISAAEKVYNHKPIDFGGQFPIVAVEAVSSNRIKKRLGRIDSWSAEFGMTVHFFVLFSDGETWTKEDADAALDTLEQQFADYMADLDNKSQTWNALVYNGASTIRDDAIIGGVQYINEQIPIMVSVGA